MAPRRSLPVALALLIGCAHAQGDADEAKLVVKDIRLGGAQRLKPRDIKKKILTTETPWWRVIWPFGQVHDFDPIAWQADLRRIERYYQANGYYQARVLGQEVAPGGQGGVRLRVEVEEGLPTSISRIQVHGLEGLPPAHHRAALARLPLREGAVFREDDWSGLKEKIRSTLLELGYAEATVEGEVAVDVATRKAEVELEIAPGPRYRFGKLIVTQDDRPRVPADRIREQARGAVRASDWYSKSALEEAQVRVTKMGVFGAVKVNHGAPDRGEGTVPVVVDVREAPFHLQKLGGGIGVDQTRNEGRLLGEYTDRNFLGGLRRLTLRAKVGYAFIPSALHVLSPEQRMEPQQRGWTMDTLAELEQPRFLFRDVRAQATLSVERDLERAFWFYAGRLKLGAIWEPVPKLSLFPSYNLEAYRLSGEITAQTNAGAQGLGCLPDDTGSCNVWLSYLELRLEYDQRDDASEPRNGYFAGLSVQGGGGPLRGSFSYLRFQPDLRAYQTFEGWDRFTVAAKLKLGTLIPLRGALESPIVARFYSGGGSSMRGFSNRRLSPLLLVPSGPGADDLAETIPVGGNGLLEASLEARYRLMPNLTLAVFLDAGFVSPGSFDLRDLGFAPRNMHYAVGIGARYLTPVGPIRIDLARRLDLGPPLPLIGPPGLRPASQPGCFGLFPTGDPTYAGAPEGQCAFHLSIGEAF